MSAEVLPRHYTQAIKALDWPERAHNSDPDGLLTKVAQCIADTEHAVADYLDRCGDPGLPQLAQCIREGDYVTP